jgi:hypothetical protein
MSRKQKNIEEGVEKLKKLSGSKDVFGHIADVRKTDQIE